MEDRKLNTGPDGGESVHDRERVMVERRALPLWERNKSLRRSYMLYMEIGLTLALALLVLAFNVYLPETATRSFAAQEQEIIEINNITPTEPERKEPVRVKKAKVVKTVRAPAPVAAPPVEVPNEVEIAEPPPTPPVETVNQVPTEELVSNIEEPLDLGEPLPTEPPPPPPPQIFEVVEEMPQIVGGLEALQKRVEYPKMCRAAGVEGRVIVMFVVDESGRVVDPKVARGIGGGCDEAAVRALQQTRFKPGKQRGEPVKVKMSVPVTFRLS